MGTLARIPAEPWPSTLGWLRPGQTCTQIGLAVCQRALADVGTLEVPQASNRGERIDRYTRRAGLPVPKNAATGEGWWWCAIWVGAVLADCGLLVPKQYPDCDQWLPFMADKPTPGSVILYGVKKASGKIDAHHIGIIVRVPDAAQPLMLSIEGNRAFAGSSNNGVAVDIGPVIRTDIIGYANPERFYPSPGV